MKNNLWINLMTALLIAGLLTSASCAKKTIASSQETINGSDGQETSQDKTQEERERIKSQSLQDQLARETALKDIQFAARKKFINQHIQFEFDSYTLTLKAKKRLKEKMEWLNANQGIAITIEGHCDERGTTEYNLALGERRSMAVKNYLTSLGIPASRMTGVSFGEEKPMNNGQNEQAHRENRRAQVIIQ